MHGGHHELHDDHSLFHVNILESFLVELEREGGGSSIYLSLWSDLIWKFYTVVQCDGVAEPGEFRYAEEVCNTVFIEPALE